jgi:hypothetical protein
MEHSLFSASAADRWMQCPGSIVLCDGLPSTTSVYAAEGTAAHSLLTKAIRDARPAADYVGVELTVDGFAFVVDAEMAAHVQTCIDYVVDAAGPDGAVTADLRVNYAAHLEVPSADAFGTLDVLIIREDELIIVDYKHGRGVAVDAVDNRQLRLYALGALEEYGSLGDFARVRLVISQPRVSAKPSEWTQTVEELEVWALGEARLAAIAVRNAIAARREMPEPHWSQAYLSPGEKQCRFCAAKATCPALRSAVVSSVFEALPATVEEFVALHNVDPGIIFIERKDDAAWLAACLSKADLIEDWIKAVRAEVERRLLVGLPVPGFKVVQGKMGNRAWRDPAEAEKLLREVFRLKVEDAYDLKLISPTSAEKLAKAGVIGPRQWPKAEALVVRAAGKPHVAPESDPRPALDVAPTSAAEFEPVDDML